MKKKFISIIAAVTLSLFALSTYLLWPARATSGSDKASSCTGLNTNVSASFSHETSVNPLDCEVVTGTGVQWYYFFVNGINNHWINQSPQPQSLTPGTPYQAAACMYDDGVSSDAQALVFTVRDSNGHFEWNAGNVPASTGQINSWGGWADIGTPGSGAIDNISCSVSNVVGGGDKYIIWFAHNPTDGNIYETSYDVNTATQSSWSSTGI